MPTSTIYTKTAAGQTAFTAEEQVGEYIVEYPLGEAEPTALVIRAPFEQFRANYARPAPNTTLTYGAVTLYFVDDAAFTDRGASLIRWTRTWASVPAAWSEPEDYAYTFPAFTGSNTYGTPYAVSALTVSGANVIISHATSSGIAAGDSVYVSINYTRGGLDYAQTWIALAVATTNTTQTTVPGWLFGSGTASAVSGFIAKSIPARASALSQVAAGRAAYDYALTTVGGLDSALPLTPAFSPVDNTGSQTDTLTATTNPTSTVYAGLVTAGTEIVVECTRARYLANIFVRKTRLVPAM